MNQLQDIPEIHKNSITVEDFNGRAKTSTVKDAWGNKKTNKHSVKKNKLIMLISFLLTALSVALSANMYFNKSSISPSSDDEIKTLLFGPSKSVNDEYKKGVLNKLLNDVSSIQYEMRVISMWANSSGCISGNGFQYKNFCYRSGSRKMAYEHAKSFCASRDGWLIFLEDETELGAILGHLWSLGYDRLDEIWVGLELIDGTWMYSNNEPANYTPWARGNIFDDGFNCAQLRTEKGSGRAGLYDRDCGDVKEFWCKFIVD